MEAGTCRRVHLDMGTFEWILHDAVAKGYRVGVVCHATIHRTAPVRPARAHRASEPSAGLNAICRADARRYVRGATPSVALRDNGVSLCLDCRSFDQAVVGFFRRDTQLGRPMHSPCASGDGRHHSPGPRGRCCAFRRGKAAVLRAGRNSAKVLGCARETFGDG